MASDAAGAALSRSPSPAPRSEPFPVPRSRSAPEPSGDPESWAPALSAVVSADDAEPQPDLAPPDSPGPIPPEPAAPDLAPPAADAAPTDEGPPARRGRYRIGELLGRGGASVVHRGWDRLLHRAVAVKLLTCEAQPPPVDRHREARVVAALDHPGLVPVYDVGRLDGCDAVVMALVEGPSLAERLRKDGPLPLAETLRMGAEVAGGLAHVHARDIVHRDVKPANILLAPGGARLTDFGIAHAPGTTTLTGHGLILGTAAYLAPEQVRGEEATSAVDMFALGLVLVECLTGRPCYDPSPSECAARLENEPTLPDDLPPRVDDFVRALTDLEASRRPNAADAAEGLHALAEALEAGGSGALDDLRPRTATARRPVPFATAVVGLLLVAAVVVAVLALVQGRADVAVPVLVGAVAAQGAVLWTTTIGRRSGERSSADRPSDPDVGPGPPRDPGARPPAPAGP